MVYKKSSTEGCKNFHCNDNNTWMANRSKNMAFDQQGVSSNPTSIIKPPSQVTYLLRIQIYVNKAGSEFIQQQQRKRLKKNLKNHLKNFK